MNSFPDLSDLFLRGGPLMWPILCCSVLALAIILFKMLEYAALFYRLARLERDRSLPPPRFLVPLLAGAGRVDKATFALTEARQVRSLERGLGALELVATIAPILGLTGTVTGMIGTFQVIGEQGAGLDPAMLAGGIWEALITTAAGLLVALPVHVALHALDDILAAILQKGRELTDACRVERGCRED